MSRRRGIKNYVVGGMMMVVGFFVPFLLHAQMPHEVQAGFRGEYWVDSMPGNGSVFEWKIDTVVVQNGPGAHFAMHWIRPGTYMLSVLETSSDGCQGQLRTCEVLVKERRELTITTINAFSPNDDNLNDVFRPLIPGDEIPPLYTLQIFNNWGELIFESNDIYKGWDGTFKSKPCPRGVYAYVITYSLNSNPEKLSGAVTLIR